MFDELWSEINDSQGEIYDVIDFKEEWEKEEKFDVESYINGNTDYWYKPPQTVSNMFSHKLPNGNIIRSDNLPRELAIQRMINEERWMKEHRAELATSSQQLFDDMFGGW